MPKRYKSDLDACKPDQLLSLLQLASRWEENTTTTRTGTGGGLQLGKKLGELCAGSRHDGPELLARAANPASSVEQLREVMLTAQTLSAEAGDEQQWHVASFLYHLSVAAALAYHSVNLSTKTPDFLIGIYEDFAAGLLEDPLGGIFRIAADRARSLF